MDWTGLVKPGLDSFVKHGLDSFVKHGLDSFVKHGLDSFVKHGLFQNILPNRILHHDAVIFQTRKDQNKSKFKEKIQHYQFDLTFYGICTFCFIFQLSI